MRKIHLSTADISPLEEAYVLRALRSGWVTSAGPDVDAFEAEIAQRVGVKHALALSSGTAALHLGLLGLGARRGTVVICPTMTFAATANAIVYTEADPVFVDCELEDGNVDAALLVAAIDALRADGVDVAAAIVVDLFGRCADYPAIINELKNRDVPLLEDAAESLGSSVLGRAAGSFGSAAIVSFNGNKVMTTSGGGMLLSDDEQLITRARYLSAQARQPLDWYEHTEIGYNYRLSNVLAGLGRAQLRRLDEMVERRHRTRQAYISGLVGASGLRILGSTWKYDRLDNCWLTCLEIDPVAASLTAGQLIEKLRSEGIEARYLWKPMHLQPSFTGSSAFLNGHAERLFNRGVALPSGSSLSDQQIDRVIVTVLAALA